MARVHPIARPRRERRHHGDPQRARASACALLHCAVLARSVLALEGGASADRLADALDAFAGAVGSVAAVARATLDLGGLVGGSLAGFTGATPEGLVGEHAPGVRQGARALGALVVSQGRLWEGDDLHTRGSAAAACCVALVFQCPAAEVVDLAASAEHPEDAAAWAQRAAALASAVRAELRAARGA